MVEQPTPRQILAVAINPWSYMFAGFVVSVWAGGKICDLIWPPERAES